MTKIGAPTLKKILNTPLTWKYFLKGLFTPVSGFKRLCMYLTFKLIQNYIYSTKVFWIRFCIQRIHSNDTKQSQRRKKTFQPTPWRCLIASLHKTDVVKEPTWMFLADWKSYRGFDAMFRSIYCPMMVKVRREMVIFWDRKDHLSSDLSYCVNN